MSFSHRDSGTMYNAKPKLSKKPLTNELTPFRKIATDLQEIAHYVALGTAAKPAFEIVKAAFNSMPSSITDITGNPILGAAVGVIAIAEAAQAFMGFYDVIKENDDLHTRRADYYLEKAGFDLKENNTFTATREIKDKTVLTLNSTFGLARAAIAGYSSYLLINGAAQAGFYGLFIRNSVSIVQDCAMLLNNAHCSQKQFANLMTKVIETAGYYLLATGNSAGFVLLASAMLLKGIFNGKTLLNNLDQDARSFGTSLSSCFGRLFRSASTQQGSPLSLAATDDSLTAPPSPRMP